MARGGQPGWLAKSRRAGRKTILESFMERGAPLLVFSISWQCGFSVSEGQLGAASFFFPSIRNACNSQNFANGLAKLANGRPAPQHLQRPTALVTAASTARESVSKGQLRTGPGTFDRDFGLACYRKRVTDRSPDSKLGGDTYWARALSCALSCSVSWELVLALVLALFARCVLGAVFVFPKSCFVSRPQR